MERVCILSDSEKASSFYESFLRDFGCKDIRITSDANTVKRSISEWGCDMCLINAPIYGQETTQLARELASDGACQIMLFIKSEYTHDIAADLGAEGIIVIEKPINPASFQSALRVIDATYGRIKKMHKEVHKMQQKLEENKIIMHAKLVLIEKKGMSESDAHRYIEKMAMDKRESKRTVAEDILDFYE